MHPLIPFWLKRYLQQHITAYKGSAKLVCTTILNLGEGLLVVCYCEAHACQHKISNGGNVRVPQVKLGSRVAANSFTPYSITRSKGAKIAYLPVELEHASTYGVNTPSKESLALAPLHAQQLLGGHLLPVC